MVGTTKMPAIGQSRRISRAALVIAALAFPTARMKIRLNLESLSEWFSTTSVSPLALREFFTHRYGSMAVIAASKALRQSSRAFRFGIVPPF